MVAQTPVLPRLHSRHYPHRHHHVTIESHRKRLHTTSSVKTQLPLHLPSHEGDFLRLQKAANNKRSDSSTLWAKLRRGHLPATARDSIEHPHSERANELGKQCPNYDLTTTSASTPQNSFDERKHRSALFTPYKSFPKICRTYTNALRTKHSAPSPRKEDDDHQSQTSRSVNSR